MNRLASLQTRWFSGRIEFLLFLILAVTGLCTSVITYRLLDGFVFNFGRNLFGVFIPPLFCAFYLALTASFRPLSPRDLIKTLLLYLIQIIPFCPLFFQKFQPTHADDFERYYIYAKNMLAGKTLWGGDALVFPNAGQHYITQPGYRYFILLELVLFHSLFRFVQFLNIALYLCVLYHFYRTIYHLVTNRWLQYGFSAIVILFTPYATKNLLMGLPEWLTAIMMMMAVYFYLYRKKEIPSIVLLGLIPFFRQNLFLTASILALLIILRSRRKLKLLILYLIPFFLPVYHNLYYAGDWRFFVDIFRFPFLHYNDATERVTGFNTKIIFDNIIAYSGFDGTAGSFSLVALLFLPFATLMYFILLRSFAGLRDKLVFFLVTMSAILPSVLLGSGYYPRFEFMNTVVMMATFLFLSKRTNPGEFASL